ncbi:hypothetical protein PLICRDRAFT_174496 [Plicaturopsis crispa FD-325 SS-3]|nr:hypothetical protein PLICRDRAFT_174496 [Plicaturopsis crispa FD-325 SS-3]
MAFIARYILFLPLFFLSNLGTALAVFQYRFYDNGGCDHASATSDTSPPNDSPPLKGDPGNCYNAPLGDPGWNRLEIDWAGQAGNASCGPNGFGAITYCNVDCAQGDSGLQIGPGMFCFANPQNCALGSFRVPCDDTVTSTTTTSSSVVTTTSSPVVVASQSPSSPPQPVTTTGSNLASSANVQTPNQAAVTAPAPSSLSSGTVQRAAQSSQSLAASTASNPSSAAPSGLTEGSQTIATSATTNSPSVAATSPAQSSSASTRLSAGTIAGIIVGVLVFCIILAFLVRRFYKRRPQDNAFSPDPFLPLSGPTSLHDSKSIVDTPAPTRTPSLVIRSTSTTGSTSRPDPSPRFVHHIDVADIPPPPPPEEIVVDLPPQYIDRRT